MTDPLPRLVDEIHRASLTIGQDRFDVLLRWHCAVHGVEITDWSAKGVYLDAIAALGPGRAEALLGDVRREASNRRPRRRGHDGKPVYAPGVAKG